MEKENENGYRNKYTNHPRDTKWQTIQKTVYDPSKNEFFGRTPKSWGQLLIFYVIFYAILAALFAICMQGLMATINDVEPKWTQSESLIGENPGLGFRPLPAKTEDGALIWYNDQNNITSQKWINLMDEFLKPYLQDTTGKNMIPCDYDRSPTGDQVCIVNTTLFSLCAPEKNYGYDTPSPCVFLKLNRIWGWEPKYYTEPTEGMPDQLVTAINGVKFYFSGCNSPVALCADQCVPSVTLATTEFVRHNCLCSAPKRSLERFSDETPVGAKENIWISCEGEGPADKEHVEQFEYFPHQGFPGYYYPFRNVKNYLSPLIAVRIVKPTSNVIVNIECRAWAKNIEYASGNLNREGSVHFEIMVDSKASS